MKSFFARIRQMPQGVKASIAFFVASMFSRGIAYITTPLYTRFLSSSEYGQVSLFLTWLEIFSVIAMFCLSYGVFNNGMMDYPKKRDEYSFSLLILSNIITLAFSGVLFALYPLVSRFLKLEIPYIILMVAVFIFQPAYNFWMARQRYEYKYKKVLVFSLLSGVLSPLVAIIFILMCKENERLFPRIFGAECTLIVFYVFFYLYLGYKSQWRIKTKYWKQAFLFNLPLIPHYLSTYLLSSSDKIMISNLVGDSFTAYYSVAHSIAALAMIVWMAINGSLVPFTYEKCKEKKYDDINRVTIPLVALFAIGCFGIMMLAPEVIKVIATEEYAEAVYAIPPIIGGVFFQVQYYIYANIIYYFKKPTYVMIGSVTAVIFNIILNYFCIKKWGYLAAGYTTVVCYLIQALIDYFAMIKIVGKSIYNTKYILLLSVGVIITSLFSNMLYDYPNARFAILFFLIALGVVFKDKIIGLFSFKKPTKHTN